MKTTGTLLHGLNIFNFKSLIDLKCLALEVNNIRLFSVAVAAMIASPARSHTVSHDLAQVVHFLSFSR